MYQVLIVDDEPIVKIALRSMIDWGELGFHICATASNGEEALELAERLHPELIICDLKMPIMDGIELIKEVKNRKLDCEFLVISNYEDFNYVRTALVLGASDYMLKVSISPEDLSAQLDKIREKLDQKATENDRQSTQEENLFAQQEIHAVWRDFFTFDSYDPDRLARITGINPAKTGALALCHISFDRYIQNMESLPSMELIRSTLKNALEQFQRPRIIFFSSSNALVILLQEELKRQGRTLADLSVRISQLFQYYMSLSPSILYQENIPDLITARDIYRNFQDLLELNFYGSLKQVDAAKIPLTSTVPGISYKDLSSGILSSATEGSARFEYASEQIHEVLDLCRQQNVIPAKVIQYCVRLIGDLEYHTSGITPGIHDQLVEGTENIRNSVSLEELSRNLLDALQSLFLPAAGDTSSTGNYSAEITQALSYISEHYNRKISLTSVADHVGLSSGYLCRIFKEETGVSINSYINNLRMTRAGELLKDQNSYIKEVAISVGFEDQLYFSRLFKRYYGVTPSEYRNLNI